MKLGIYRHYKNKEKEYEVIGFAKGTDNLNDYVVYKALYNNEVSNLWVRRLEEFTGTVNVDGVKIPRFTLISEKQYKEIGLSEIVDLVSQQEQGTWHFHFLTPQCKFNDTNSYKIVLETNDGDYATLCKEKPMTELEKIESYFYGRI